MATAYFDCFAGAGGDMIVGALLDAGADFDALQAELGKLRLTGCEVRVDKVSRAGLVGSKFHVDITSDTTRPHRTLADIRKIITDAGLPKITSERADRIFTRLAKAEAKVHGARTNEIHFHEVGAEDSIMDIVGACIAMELLSIDCIFCSPMPIGQGTVRCAHGEIPLPSPATAALLKGVETAACANAGELTTPTAAAILTTLGETFGPMPAMIIASVGYGAGTREDGPLPNLLRVFVGQQSEAGQTDTVVELSANVDDCSGEVLGDTLEKLLASGCLDAWASPIYMKKSRPAWMISALAAEADVARAERIFFEQTTTFGVRRRRMTRSKLDRTHEMVETPFGPIRIKIGRLDGQEITASPEFADCRTAAESHHVAVREVIEAVKMAWKQERLS